MITCYYFHLTFNLRILCEMCKSLKTLLSLSNQSPKLQMPHKRPPLLFKGKQEGFSINCLVMRKFKLISNSSTTISFYAKILMYDLTLTCLNVYIPKCK